MKGIFDTQVISLEGLYIRLTACDEGIKVKIYDGENCESQYIVELPEGSSVEIKRTKKTKIFEWIVVQ